MARIFKTPFGAQGDTEQVPEAPQGDGSVSLTQGFGYDYEREYEDPAAKDIRREVMNGLFHDITEAIGDIQISGIAKWDSAAAPYPAGAVVWHNNNAWLSMVGNNSVAPTEGANWSAVMPQKTVTDALDTKADKTTQIIAGTGLTGGGNLTADRTISIANSHIPIGVGQTWQNVNGSRALGVTYTNTTGRTIIVTVVGISISEGERSSISLFVDGINVDFSQITGDAIGGNGYPNVSAAVPSGSSYRVSTGTFDANIYTWRELR